MKRLIQRILPGILPAVATFALVGCGSDGERVEIASKQECIVEASRRLLACAEDQECETGVARYAGYCYNTAPGDQLDICRGGDYFFQRPLAEATREHPEVAQLDSRQREIIIRGGEVYCNFNYN
jgi:hypothetical protein